MKSLVLYYSKIDGPALSGRNPVFDSRGRCVGYVRAEVVDNDVGPALDDAKPREGETVLNTVPIES